MLIAVPDAISCAPNPDEGAPPCTPQGAATTSNGNRYYDNVMGRTPDGRQMPNGVDFWWDEFPTNSGNCWFRNQRRRRHHHAASRRIRRHRRWRARRCPSSCPRTAASPSNVGVGDARKESVLLGCVADFAEGSYDATVCDWFAPPAKPGSGGGRRRRQRAAALRCLLRATRSLSPRASADLLGGEGGTLTCTPFLGRI